MRERGEIWNIIKIAERRSSWFFHLTEAETLPCKKKQKKKKWKGRKEVRRVSASSSWNWIEFHAEASRIRSCLSVTSRVQRQSNRPALLLLVNHPRFSRSPHSHPSAETLADTLIKMKWIFNYKKKSAIQWRGSGSSWRSRRASEQFKLKSRLHHFSPNAALLSTNENWRTWPKRCGKSLVELTWKIGRTCFNLFNKFWILYLKFCFVCASLRIVLAAADEAEAWESETERLKGRRLLRQVVSCCLSMLDVWGGASAADEENISFI